MVWVALGLLLSGSTAGAAAAADTGVPVLSAGYLAAPPALSATLAPAQWQAAGATDSFHRFGDGGLLPAAPLMRVAFDDRCFYLAVTVPLPAGVRPKAEVRERDGQVWADDALEVFIDPTNQHQAEYQFIVNAAGARTDLRDQGISWNGEWEAVAAVQPDAWTAVLAIPWKTLVSGRRRTGRSSASTSRGTGRPRRRSRRPGRP
jgi:hypothetical protein